MTGYGRGEAKRGSAQVVVELKSVNHRHLEIAVNLPAPFWGLEAKLKERLRAGLQRGHVDVWLQVTAPEWEQKIPVVDMKLAARYAQAYARLARLAGDRAAADTRWVASQPEVFRLVARPAPLQKIFPLLEKALAHALQRLQGMRRAEGGRLAADIRKRLRMLGRLKNEIQQRSAANLRRVQWDRAQASTVRPEGPGEPRNGNNAAARLDVTEELVRLGSHLDQFSEFLKSRRPVGRALDFLIQEINREINTVGSKSMDTAIAHRVVAAKEELEKIREQVQNLE
jgi:uncharacterized protein (TIGR00255 family)